MHRRAVFTLVVLTLLLSIVPRAACAQTEADGWAAPEVELPTSGDASLLSGRTLGVGEAMIGAALGFPGLWAQLELAPSSTFNLGIRLGVLYGSPNMGVGIGGGGTLAIPMRIHLWGERDTDVSLRLCPNATVGEGVLMGESLIFAHAFGFSARLDAGVLIGFQPDPRITFIFGVDAGAGLSYVEASSAFAIGVFQARLGMEGLLARDTMLFGEVTLGGGIAPDRVGTPLYPDRFALGVSLGLGYLL